MNVGSGTHVSIKELAFLIKKIVNYDGQIILIGNIQMASNQKT